MFVKANSLVAGNVIIFRSMRLKVESASHDREEMEVNFVFTDKKNGKEVKFSLWESELVNRIDGVAGVIR